jgi:hypothetical protein
MRILLDFNLLGVRCVATATSHAAAAQRNLLIETEQPDEILSLNITWQRPALPFLATITLFGLPATAATYPDTVKADNPIAYYRLEETSDTTAADSSASGLYPATYNVSGAYPQLGQPGIDTNSTSLSAVQSASVTAGYYADLNPQGPFSFEVWARPPRAECALLPIGNFGGWGFPRAVMFINNQAGLRLSCGTPLDSSGYSLFNWYHLVGTCDGTNGAF